MGDHASRIERRRYLTVDEDDAIGPAGQIVQPGRRRRSSDHQKLIGGCDRRCQHRPPGMGKDFLVIDDV